MSKKGGRCYKVLLRQTKPIWVVNFARKTRKRTENLPNEDAERTKHQSLRGRGTDKTPVIGAVERGGKVVAEIAENLTGRRILEFIKRAVKIEDSELMTDQFHAYHAIGREMKHQIVNHQEQFVDGDVHTNTIEGFWSLLKRA